jgi:hypothetical protein
MPQTYHSWMIYTVYTVHTTSWWSYWGFWLGYTTCHRKKGDFAAVKLGKMRGWDDANLWLDRLVPWYQPGVPGCYDLDLLRTCWMGTFQLKVVEELKWVCYTSLINFRNFRLIQRRFHDLYLGSKLWYPAFHTKIAASDEYSSCTFSWYDIPRNFWFNPLIHMVWWASNGVENLAIRYPGYPLSPFLLMKYIEIRRRFWLWKGTLCWLNPQFRYTSPF